MRNKLVKGDRVRVNEECPYQSFIGVLGEEATVEEVDGDSVTIKFDNGATTTLYSEDLDLVDDSDLFPHLFYDYCSHEWVTYEGITNRFDYCKKCDERRK